MNIVTLEERIVGPVVLVLKRFDRKTFRHNEEFRIFVNFKKSGNPFSFHGPYYSLPVAKGQMTRIAKDPRFRRKD